MQEHQKLLKKQNKSALNHKTREIVEQSNDIQGLLKIDLITIPERTRSKNQMQKNHSREATSRKSHRSLAINLQKLSKPPKNVSKKQKEVHKVETGKKNKFKTQKTTDKQPVQQINQQQEKAKQPAQYAKQSFEKTFVEKKMKVGQKVKNNAMKEFILQTLMKGKAQGTCLVIHKGTGQCSYSPISKNKSETSKYQKEQFPLVLEQESSKNAGSRNKPVKSMFGSKQKKVNRSSSTNSTAINLPSINKKWVKMARQYEKKGNRQDIVEQNIEVIEQRIEVGEEQTSNEQQQIREQIIISNNDSIINEKTKAI